MYIYRAETVDGSSLDLKYLNGQYSDGWEPVREISIESRSPPHRVLCILRKIDPVGNTRLVETGK